MATERLPPFVLQVSLVGGHPVAYGFDQPRVLVGRGRDADLRIEHAGVARAQFVIERGTGSLGEARFRITPLDATNPTYVNDRPAVEGTLMPGDVVAVTEVRVVLERKVDITQKTNINRGLSPRTLLLLTAVVAMGALVAWLYIDGGADPSAGELAATQTRLFADPLPESQVRCANPIECDTRAHDAYAHAKKLTGQTGADPGNFYRATLEFERAARYREQSGRPLPDMADVGALGAQARSRAESEFADAKFRLQRAMAAGDRKRCAAEAALLAHLVPDEGHPYRVKLDAYRRTLPPARAPGTFE
jgi:FHA domain-containing protein